MLNINQLEAKLQEIIERKYLETKLGKNPDAKFAKIGDLEGNAVGQIGEEYSKFLISQFVEIIDDGIIHDEYDIQTKNGVFFEVKTARKGNKNNTFQFNGINPNYNYNYLLCIGICEDAVLFRIFEKKDISYHHKDRKFYIRQGNFEKQLVSMNPNNQVNFKLTLNLKELISISLLHDQIQTILQ
ncbi:MAG: hypothetical protein LBE11_03380 [Prevotellaceae bacterium]|jgi:hypothetical protein|nr:hypothetical protein [Prevotellaceae bacterium]